MPDPPLADKRLANDRRGDLPQNDLVKRKAARKSETGTYPVSGIDPDKDEFSFAGDLAKDLDRFGQRNNHRESLEALDAGYGHEWCFYQPPYAA